MGLAEKLSVVVMQELDEDKKKNGWYRHAQILIRNERNAFQKKQMKKASITIPVTNVSF